MVGVPCDLRGKLMKNHEIVVTLSMLGNVTSEKVQRQRGNMFQFNIPSLYNSISVYLSKKCSDRLSDHR